MHAIASSNALPHSTAHRSFPTLAALGIVATLLNSPQASAFTVSYDFESVSVPAATDSIDVCQPTCPTTVAAGLPDGDDGIRASSGGSAGRVNVRSEYNAINAVDGAAPDTVFDGFFSTGTTVAPNRFLVLGDNDGAVHGTGTVTPGTGQSFVRLPFFVPLATAAVSFSFDAVFEGIDSSATLQDTFTVKLSNATGTASPTTIYQRGSDEGFAALTLGGAQLPTWLPDPADTGRTWWLEFELVELGDGTQSAVGLDNITISSVPLPAPLSLLGSALVAMATTRRRGLHPG
jgi:hypothetical protein